MRGGQRSNRGEIFSTNPIHKSSWLAKLTNYHHDHYHDNNHDHDCGKIIKNLSSNDRLTLHSTFPPRLPSWPGPGVHSPSDHDGEHEDKEDVEVDCDGGVDDGLSDNDA